MKIRFSSNTISFGTLARLCQGELHQGALGEVFARFICTDSRETDAETVFVALRGERTDGHRYISQALQNGCRCIICEHSSEEIEAAGATAIVVNDTELAIAKLCNGYKHQYLHTRNIGVTGSVGKTTTKDLISSVLSTEKRTYKTPGNYNSLVGMPFSVMETPMDCEWSVLEMGMSDFGEVERLSIAAEPEIGIITNIGSSHMEMLGSRENICRAKLEILCGLRDGGTLLLNGDEPMLRNIGGKSYHTLYVSLEREEADFFAKNIKVEPDCTRFDIVYRGVEYQDFCIRVMGRHNIYAALFAFACAMLAGVDEASVRRGMLAFEPSGMRQHIFSLGEFTVIEDCYNASPESMIAAVDVLEEYSRRTGRRSIAVLGDMLELGNESPALHRSVGVHVAKKKIDRLFTLGLGGHQIAVGARQKGMHADQVFRNLDVKDLQGVADALKETLQSGDVVLFKASRAVGLEGVIHILQEQFPQYGEN